MNPTPTDPQTLIGASGMLQLISISGSKGKKLVKKISKTQLPKDAIQAKLESLIFLKENPSPLLFPLLSFWQDSEFIFVESLMLPGRPLSELVIQSKYLPVLAGLAVIKQLLSICLEYSSKRFMHYDIRCEKIIIDDEGRVTLVDNGCSLPFSGKDMSNFAIELDTIYLPPEGLSNGVGETHMVYALGMIWFFMLCGEMCWYEPPEDERQSRIEYPRKVMEKVSQEIRNTIEEMVKFRKENRPSLKELLVIVEKLEKIEK